MPEDFFTYGGLVLFVAGFVTAGFQIVYAINDAEHLVPSWLWRLARSRAVFLLLNEWDIAWRASLDVCRDVAALLILLTTSPKGAMAA